MQVTSLGFRTDVALRRARGRRDHRPRRLPGRPHPRQPRLLLGELPAARRLARTRHRGRLAGPVRGRVPAGPARRARRGCRGRAGGDAGGVPGRGAGAGARHGAHLRRRPAAAEPEHRGRDPPAGVRRRLAAILRAGRPLLRRGRALPGATDQGQAAADRGGAGGLVRRVHRRPPAGPARGVRCRRRAGPLPGRRDRPRGPPPGPGRDAGLARGPLRAARRSARARSSSWPTRRRRPSGSTAPAASPTRRASSASSGRRKANTAG